MRAEACQVLLAALEARGEVQRNGKGWRTRCPNPDHEDQHPSFFLYPGGGGRCFSQCGRFWNPDELAEFLGVRLPSQRQGLTLAELAQAKGIPEAFLRAKSVTDSFTGAGSNRVPCVAIPYPDKDGTIVAQRKRLSLHGENRFLWRRGDHPMLYGLGFLKEIKRVGYVILVEGESDCWTLWLHRFPALGVPGASNWRESYAALLAGLDIYVWHEPDGGGDTLLAHIRQNLPDVRIVEAPADAKDVSELHLFDPDGFRERLGRLLQEARPASTVGAEALTARARQCFAVARPLLEYPDLLGLLSQLLAKAGFAGDPRPALMAFVALVSRLLDAPLNLAYISPSGAGKNAAIEAVLPFFPQSAYYLVRASSPRALIFNVEQFTHRTVIVLEADSIPEEGPAASAIRSLMSDGEMTYEIVEKGEDGKFVTRRITKPGPTGLLTSSIRPLGQQASTRTLTVTISDSAEQTRQVLHSQADRINGDIPTLDLSPWQAMQEWLALAGDRRVVIPFAHELAQRVPANLVRMRRDFPQLLVTVQTVALLAQRRRERDAARRIVATVEDYARARWLLEEVFATTASEGATPAVRDTVRVVAELAVAGEPVSETDLVRKTGLAKGTISYRVRRAVEGGWLVNLSHQRGAPAQLILGAPLAGGNHLPEPDELGEWEGSQVGDSNIRTPAGATATVQEEMGATASVRTGFEPRSNGPSNAPDAWPEGVFEVFESQRTRGAPPHTRGEERPANLPWDAFLSEEDADGAQSD